MKTIKCPKCGSSQVWGLYREDDYSAIWEPVNSPTSSCDPDEYDKFECEDCDYRWEE